MPYPITDTITVRLHHWVLQDSQTQSLSKSLVGITVTLTYTKKRASQSQTQSLSATLTITDSQSLTDSLTIAQPHPTWELRQNTFGGGLQGELCDLQVWLKVYSFAYLDRLVLYMWDCVQKLFRVWYPYKTYEAQEGPEGMASKKVHANHVLCYYACATRHTQTQTFEQR